MTTAETDAAATVVAGAGVMPPVPCGPSAMVSSCVMEADAKRATREDASAAELVAPATEMRNVVLLCSRLRRPPIM